MSPDDGMALLLACAAAFALSALLTLASIRYGRRRQLIDQPGRRRSHTLPTPRGGGIGIVVAVLVCALVPALLGRSDSGTQLQLTLVAVALLIVAAIGWIDDHRGLGRRIRFIAQLFAGVLVLASFPVGSWWSGNEGNALHIAIVLIAALTTVVWSINLHNFMDGINGLLALQAIFVLATIALLSYVPDPWSLQGAHGLAIIVFAILGFLPFNFPRARVFMGDVGSGSLGLIVAVAVLWQIAYTTLALGTGIILCSVFVTDATATLVSRFARGRRWYSPHREHLYQWLVRSRLSHANVVAIYMAWNVIVVLPVVCWINRADDVSSGQHGGEVIVPFGKMIADGVDALPAVALVYALTFVAWMLGKRFCVTRAKLRIRG